MILVVAEELSLRFVLLHQGKFIQSVRTATDALRVLRNGVDNLQGVVLDDKITNSRLVSGYVRSHIPNLTMVTMQTALRYSPFSDVPPDPGMAATARQQESARYVWDRSHALQAQAR